MEPVESAKRPRGEPITLDTVVPEMPTKSERLHAPSEDEHKKKLSAIDDRIAVLQGKRVSAT
jgi:hypothetical protein